MSEPLLPGSIRIETGSRLHFGLLDVRRPFGGCGVMIDHPQTLIEIGATEEFHCDQICRSRAASIAANFPTPEGNLPSVGIRVLKHAPAHSGLGSGTQLSLAIAEGIARMLQIRDENVWLAAAGRGQRSAVGTHGYLHGGLIVEGIDPMATHNDAINAIDFHLQLPGDWHVAVLLPKDANSVTKISGSDEQTQFAKLPDVPRQIRAEMSRQLVEDLVPSVERHDFERFCTSVTRYNRESGELFAPVQGGPYHGEATSRLIEQLLDQGYSGVGQSSWGPGVFVWFPSFAEADAFRDDPNWQLSHSIQIAHPRANGRTIGSS